MAPLTVGNGASAGGLDTCNTPAMAHSKPRGFGFCMISEGVAFDLNDTVSLDFDPEGVICRIEVPLVEPLS